MWYVNNFITYAFLLCFIVACSSSRNEIQEQEEIPPSSPPPPVVPLSPESAKVDAYILEYNEKGENLICRIRIEKVLAYGPATPPVASGSNLSVEISNKLLNENPEVRRKFFQNEPLFSMTIMMSKGGIGITNTGKQIWKVINLK